MPRERPPATSQAAEPSEQKWLEDASHRKNSLDAEPGIKAEMVLRNELKQQVPVLIADRSAGGHISNDELRSMFRVSVTDRTFTRIRAYCDVPGRKGRVHFCIGQMVILWADHFHAPLIWMAALMSGFVLLLEFWYDPTYEKGQTIREDIKDTIFYFLGIWSAYGILR